MYLRIINDTPVWYYNNQRLRDDEPNISFPEIISDELLLEYNVFPITIDSRPNINYNQTAVLQEPVLENGEWVQHWSISDLDEQTAQEILLKLAGDIRRNRDQLLQQCDWTQGKDISDEVSNKWKQYRQELRDITIQEGFPTNIVWPDRPA